MPVEIDLATHARRPLYRNPVTIQSGILAAPARTICNAAILAAFCPGTETGEIRAPLPRTCAESNAGHASLVRPRAQRDTRRQEAWAMRKTIRKATIPFAVSVLGIGLCTGLRADDFKLKDGSKISGTIVGFDDNSFKVQTSYGFALVRKDQVVSITVSDPAAAKTQAPTNTTTTPAATPAAATDKKSEAASDALKTSAAKSLTTASAATALKTATASSTSTSAAPIPASAVVAKVPPAPAAPAVAMTPATPPPAPAQAAPPEPIRENVDGNTYTNLTYGFHMYKPPGWNVIEGARSLMPGTIAAMGTLDQTTYLLIGQSPAGKSLTSDIDSADQRLRGLMDNFRPLGESRVNVSGAQGVERKFRGSLDQKDWSGTVVYFSRGGQLYTIFGITIADTDLVQIQENVISRAITSLQFAQ
jgi:hypothetical protein